MRAWVEWLNAYKPPTVIVLERCPAHFVKNFSIVKGFLSPQTQVESLYVPYYAPETNEYHNFLAFRGTHFSVTGGFNLSEQRDSKGRPMEPDVILEPYFAFLKLQK